MKRSMYKKNAEAEENSPYFAAPAQLHWFNELRDALSPYWSARAEHTSKTTREISDKTHHSDAA